MSTPPFPRAALAYARLGIAVFPLKAKDKKPLSFTTGLSAASADPDLALDRWAGRVTLPLREPKHPGERLPREVRAGPMCNVACATGEISGFWVLDLDGDVAEAGLAALVAVHGPLPETPEQKTGGGRQLFFAWDPAFEVRNSAGKVGKDIDVRGNGGYVVLPPSVHPGKPERGIPPGRIYTWAPGKSPRDIAFAAAPEWLLKLVCPPEAPVAPPAERKTPASTVREGGTSKFGQATLNTSCRIVASAPPGKQQSTLFSYAAFIGAYVAGGEIDRDQAKRELIDAGLRMVATRGAWTAKEVESAVERGMTKGEAHPKSAPAPETFRKAGPREADRAPETAVEAAGEIRAARALWDAARSADCQAVRSWFAHYGLDPQGLPGGLGRMKAHARAPIGRGEAGPALLIPLAVELDAHDWGDVEALAILPLQGRPRLSGFIGPAKRKAACLCAWPADGALLVALDFLDAWSLGQAAHESGHELGVILAPTLRAFAGGPLGDRWGRVDPRTPHGDPDDPPWTAAGERPVFLAVRGDIRSPEFKVRKTFGGSDRVTLEGRAAARFYGGLAEQAWRKAGANPVRIMWPSVGAGFSQGRGA